MLAEKLLLSGYQLVIWNPHCIVGTPGHNLQENLSNALREWSKKEHANIDFVTKGTNPYTEHYGALRAEVDDPTDPGSQLNTDLLETLAESDIILVTGEAFSHCVKETMDQIVENIGQEHLKKIRMMTDCTSSIGAIPNGPNFPEITKAWLKEIQKKGVGVTTSTTFFN